MYIAALRIADDFGCDLVGIQYQQGLKDLLPASDLVEGTSGRMLSPRPGLGAPISLQSWNNQLTVDSVTDPRLHDRI